MAEAAGRRTSIDAGDQEAARATASGQRTGPRPGDRPSDGRSDGREEGRRDGRTIGELLGRLGSETATLARLDFALARAEAGEKLKSVRRGGILLAVGTAVLLVALLPLVETLVRGLTALFDGWMGLDMAVWAAPLVVALIVGVVGYALIRAGTRSLREENLVPEKTADSLRRQERWMRARVRELRRE